MGDNWIPGAERIGSGSIGGAMDTPDGPARVVWHTTESGAGDGAFDSVGNYLVNIAAEPHILYDPTTDRIGQYGPLGQSARALRNDGATRTNRVGAACIQIEVLARAARPFTSYWQPGPNFRALMAAIRSWGIPDHFPMGYPPAYPGGSRRDRTVWLNQGGHYGHANVPGNDHGDPGAIDPAALFGAAGGSAGTGGDGGGNPAPTVSRAQTVINGLVYGYGAQGEHVTAVGRALVGAGFGSHYAEGPGPLWSDADTANYRDYQQSLGFSGSDADGVPGETSLRRLLGYLPGGIEPFPGADFFQPGRHSGVITRMGERLVAEGCGRYAVGPGPDWGAADQRSYAAWQRRLGYGGSAADGVPGQTSWDRLRVPTG
ncbi:peptidoglycan-binding protein [Kitasatospora sp. Ki12]